MAQFHVLSNFYKITSLTAFNELLSRLQVVSGQAMEGDRDHYEFNVGPKNDPSHLYVLDFVENEEREKGINVKLGGKELINDPMHNLRSAEELMTMMITLREFNSKPGREFMGEEQMAVHGYLSQEARDDEFRTQMAAAGITNFFQQYDPLSWLEIAHEIQEYGDVESGELVTIKTSVEGIATGVYTIKKVVTDDRAGIEVMLDGQPHYNYPLPANKSAEQVVAYILLLKKNLGTYVPGVEFKHNPENPKPLVATVRDGQNEIRLFCNGTITITGPGVMKMVTMADSDSARANELMEQILELTQK
jgi:hypothetical protein